MLHKIMAMGKRDGKLSEYININLGLSIEEYSELEGTPARTLYQRWKTDGGRKTIKDAVLRIYIKRFFENERQNFEVSEKENRL